MKLILNILGWGWAIFLMPAAIGLLTTGEVIAGLCLLVSALFGIPPLWRKLSEQFFEVKRVYRILGGGIAFTVAALVMAPSSTTKPSLAEGNRNGEKETGKSLGDLEAKLGRYSVIEMERADYPKLFAKLKSDGFERANALAKWAGITAAMSDRCAPKVDIVGVSDRSTQDAIQWFVDCENGERFQITETQAKTTKSRFEAEPKDEKVANSALVEPNSSALDRVSEAKVVAGCDNMVKASMKSRGSYDASWSYNFRKHPAQGRVSVSREFEAQNSFGATISSEYVCLVDAKSMTPISIRIREATGWETIYEQ